MDNWKRNYLFLLLIALSACLFADFPVAIGVNLIPAIEENGLNLDLAYRLENRVQINSGVIAMMDSTDEFDLHLTGGLSYSYKPFKRITLEPSARIDYILSDENELDFLLMQNVNLYIIPEVSVGFSAGYLFNIGEPLFRVGLQYDFGFRDKDRDWIRDSEDFCLRTPHGARVDKKGCGIDSDADGVYDGLDKCPNTPELAFVNEFGCPADIDNDGVYDGVDRCPDTPSDIPVDEFGCPADSDGDKIPDFEDDCPNTPQLAWVDASGCPKDSDEDGVLDGIDRCPGTPTGFDVDRFGCPYVMPVDSIVITDFFDASLNIKGTAAGRLESVTERIRAYPDRKIEIRCYTDSEGSPQYNYNRASRVLSRVEEFLSSRGVEPTQIQTKAMGERNPIFSNSSVNGRNKNRRIEIISVS